MLEVSALKAAYDRAPVLMGIDFQLRDREFLGILGHNGMGKTTLMPVAADGVVFLDTDVTRLKPYERVRLGMGYVPQGREIVPNLSVMDNLRMGCIATGREKMVGMAA